MVLAATMAPEGTYRRPRYTRNWETPVLAEPRTDSTLRAIEGLEVSSRPPNQSYYWTEEWQQAEEAARADIMAGRIISLAGPEQVEEHFAALSRQGRSAGRRRGTTR